MDSLSAPSYSLAVVIPVFDHEVAVAGVLEALAPSGLPCIVVDDGSGALCRTALEELASRHASWVTLHRLAINQGKGEAVITGCRLAHARGFTHILQIDADGQHDLGDLPTFRALSEATPRAVICGAPKFDDSVPRARKYGRLLTSLWVWINTLSFSIADAMCGYRVYPLAPLIRIFDANTIGKRMEFDPEVLVRLSWAETPVVNVATHVRYPTDGRSHFRMVRDNVLISLMHARLFFGMLLRAPRLLRRMLRRPARAPGASLMTGALPPAKPKAAGPTHWAAVAEVGSAKGILILYWVYERLGRLPFQIALLPVALYFFLLKPSQRRASREFLTRCRRASGSSRPPSHWDVLRHFSSFGEALLDKFVAWNGGIHFDDVNFHGYPALRECFDRGRGVLLLGSHLGNLEVCRALSQRRPGLRLRVLVHTRHATMFNRLLTRLNPNSQVSLQQVSELGVAEAAELASWVASGGVVLIAADRVPVLQDDRSGGASSPRVSFAPFLGHSAPFPEGPFILASLLGCPVFLLFCLRRARRFEAIFEPFADPLRLPRKDRAGAIRAHVTRYAERLGAHAGSAPFQWFNFFPFWSQHERT